MKLFEDLMNKAEKLADQAVKVGKEAFDQTKVIQKNGTQKYNRRFKQSAPFFRHLITPPLIIPHRYYKAQSFLLLYRRFQDNIRHFSVLLFSSTLLPLKYSLFQVFSQALFLREPLRQSFFRTEPLRDFQEGQQHQ